MRNIGKGCGLRLERGTVNAQRAAWTATALTFCSLLGGCAGDDPARVCASAETTRGLEDVLVSWINRDGGTEFKRLDETQARFNVENPRLESVDPTTHKITCNGILKVDAKSDAAGQVLTARDQISYSRQPAADGSGYYYEISPFVETRQILGMAAVEATDRLKARASAQSSSPQNPPSSGAQPNQVDNSAPAVAAAAPTTAPVADARLDLAVADPNKYTAASEATLKALPKSHLYLQGDARTLDDVGVMDTLIKGYFAHHPDAGINLVRSPDMTYLVLIVDPDKAKPGKEQEMFVLKPAPGGYVIPGITKDHRALYGDDLLNELQSIVTH